MNSSAAELQVTKESELYLRFKDERPCWPFIGLSLTFGMLATVGIVLNTLHIYVTIKTKSLHGTSFILLALLSAFESVHLSGHFLFPFVALSGQNFIDYVLAAKICAPSFLALQCIGLLMLSAGIDRLISIMFPIFYKRKKSTYMFAVFLLCTVNSVYAFVLLIKTANNSKISTMKIPGFFGDLYQGEDLNGLPSQISFYINIISVIVYIVIGIILLAKPIIENSATNVDQERNKRIFKSLCLIISVNIGGYSLHIAFRIFILPSFKSSITIWFAMVILAIPLVISAISNAPILYYTSSQYREAFAVELKKFSSLVGLGNLSSAGNNTISASGQLFQTPTIQLISVANWHANSLHSRAT